MSEYPTQPLPRDERFKTLENPITEADFKKLIELGVSNLPDSDRNVIVVKSRRDTDFSDKNTSNTNLRRNYVIDNLGIDIAQIEDDKGEKMKTRLVGETIYLVVTCAKAYEKKPELKKVYLGIVNRHVKLSREKHELLTLTRQLTDSDSNSSAQIEHLTADGIPLSPNDDPLSESGLNTIWDILENALTEKFPQT